MCDCSDFTETVCRAFATQPGHRFNFTVVGFIGTIGEASPPGIITIIDCQTDSLSCQTQ